MKATVTLHASKDEADAEALALADNDWRVAVTGPLDQTEIWQGEKFVASYAGAWLLVATQADLRQL